MGLREPNEALQELRELCDAGESPYVEDSEIQRILTRCKLAQVYEGSTAYTVGQRLFVDANNRSYVVIASGTSPATAPSWPDYRSAKAGKVFSPGDTLLLRDDGPQHPDLWDMGAARRQVLLLKAAKCAKEVDTKEGGVDQKLSQLHAHYQASAAQYDSEFTP